MHEYKYEIQEVKTERYYSFGVTLFVNEKACGSMDYSLREDHLYIHRMDNYTLTAEKAWKHVGAILFEHAFHQSVCAGKGGKIMLDAIGASPAPYFKLGLRKVDMDGNVDEKANNAFAKELAHKPRFDSADYYRHYMNGTMCLPPDMIAEKKKLFFDQDGKRKRYYRLEVVDKVAGSVQNPSRLFAVNAADKVKKSQCCEKFFRRLKALIS